MTERYKTRTYIKIITIAVLLCIVLGYTTYEIRRIISGPEITVLTPKDGAVIATSTISITGFAKNISDITLDDRPISIDESGNFSETLLLSSGYNAIELRAHDRFGGETQKTLEVIYQ